MFYDVIIINHEAVVVLNMCNKLPSLLGNMISSRRKWKFHRRLTTRYGNLMTSIFIPPAIPPTIERGGSVLITF